MVSGVDGENELKRDLSDLFPNHRHEFLPSMLAKRENFISLRTRLWLTSKWSANETTSQGRLRRIGDDVKKSLRLLSEERLSPREVKPSGFVRHFLSTKNGGQLENESPWLIALFLRKNAKLRRKQN